MNDETNRPTVLFGKTYMWRRRSSGQWRLIRVEWSQ